MLHIQYSFIRNLNYNDAILSKNLSIVNVNPYYIYGPCNTTFFMPGLSYNIGN